MEFSGGLGPVLVRAIPVVQRRAGSGWKCSLSGDIHSHNSICIKEVDSQACKIHSLRSGWIYFAALVQLCIPRCHQSPISAAHNKSHQPPLPITHCTLAIVTTWTKSKRRQFMLSSSSQELCCALQLSTEALPGLWQLLCPRPWRIPCPAPLPRSTQCLAPPRAQRGRGWAWSLPPGCPEFPRTAQRVPGSVHLLRKPPPLQLTPPKEPFQNWDKIQTWGQGTKVFLVGNVCYTPLTSLLLSPSALVSFTHPFILTWTKRDDEGFVFTWLKCANCSHQQEGAVGIQNWESQLKQCNSRKKVIKIEQKDTRTDSTYCLHFFGLN